MAQVSAATLWSSLLQKMDGGGFAVAPAGLYGASAVDDGGLVLGALHLPPQPGLRASH